MDCKGGEGRQAGREGGLRVFNGEDLLRNLGGDTGLLDCIVAMYLDDATGEMERLRKAVGRSDAVGAAQLAHKMKGAAANVRAEVFSAVLADVEKAVFRQDIYGAAPLLEEAAAELERFRRAMEERRP